jgi:hypothetical protein
MPIFYCPQHPNYMLWTGTRWLEFRSGVLSTDDAGAASLRRHPLYGRLFSDIPPEPVIDPHPELRLAGMLTMSEETYDCDICSETFPSRMQLTLHCEKVHKEDGHGERQGPIGEGEVQREGQGERHSGGSRAGR